MSHGRALEALAHARSAMHGHGHGDPTIALRDLFVARGSLSGVNRRTADALLARPTDSAGPDDRFKLTGAITTLPTAHFSIHYVTAGDDVTSGEFASTVAQTLESVYAREVAMGFRAPLTDLATASAADKGNPDGKFDVFLGDIGSSAEYGYVSVDGSSRATRQPAYMVLDNDFLNSAFGGQDPVEALQVTVAHEFFHAIQYGYDLDEDVWLMEGSSVWMEDEVYPGINDYAQYVRYSPIRRPAIPVDYDDGNMSVYGAFSFFKFLDARLRDPHAVREVWEAAQASGGHNRFSLQAVTYVVARHGLKMPYFLSRYAVWNTLPPGSYGDRALYGSPRFRKDIALTPTHRDTWVQSATLGHLASAPIRVRTSSHLPVGSRLRIGANVPSLSHGARVTIEVRRTDGRVSTTSMRLNRYGNGATTLGFSPRTVSSVVIIATNGSTLMRSCSATRSYAYSCRGYGYYSGQVYKLRAHLV